MSIESSVFFGGMLAKDEATANNDMGFDEAAALMDAARMNTTTADPTFPAGFNAAVIPANPELRARQRRGGDGQRRPRPRGFDATATYAGAVDPARPLPGTPAGPRSRRTRPSLDRSIDRAGMRGPHPRLFFVRRRQGPCQ